MLSHKAGDACDKPGAQAVSGSHSNRKLWLPPFFPSSSALPLLKPLFGVTANPNTGHPVFSGGLGALEDHVMGSGPSTHLFNAKFWVSLTLRTGDKEIQQQVQMSVLLTSLGHIFGLNAKLWTHRVFSLVSENTEKCLLTGLVRWDRQRFPGDSSHICFSASAGPPAYLAQHISGTGSLKAL